MNVKFHQVDVKIFHWMSENVNLLRSRSSGQHESLYDIFMSIFPIAVCDDPAISQQCLCGE